MRLFATLVLLAATLGAPALAADAWRRIDNPPPVTGLDGQPHAASCSAYPGTDATFRFWTRRGRSPNLVVYFEGGGACWDDVTCTFPFGKRLPGVVPQFYSAAVPPRSAPRDDAGLFDNTRADNPLKDWTAVYIPYCTGDLHLGSARRTYRNVGHPVYDLPPEFEIRHQGYDNFMVVLDWVRRHVRTPQKVLVAGSSAGGYGAAGNFPWLGRLYPDAQLSVLADASQGVTTPAFDTGLPGRGSWNEQLAPWVFGADVVPGPELLRAGARAVPGARFAQYTTTEDAVQIGFYAYMKAAYGPGGSCPDTAADWNRQMLATLSSYTGELANFRSFVAPGTDHTILRSAAYYTPVPWAAQGSFAGWLSALLDRSAGAPAWADAACPDCLTPQPCP